MFLHGGAQNAHTWDSVALALGRPLVTVDMPGHGHSDWRDDHDYGVAAMAADIAPAIQDLAPAASLFVGIGLGAPIALLIAHRLGRPASRVALVDSAAGVRRVPGEPRASQSAEHVGASTALHRFASFDDLLQRTFQYNEIRSQQSLRRGARHNRASWRTGRGNGDGIRPSAPTATTPSRR